ncbi:BTB/POZ domain-containing protein 16 isoform X1 [Silurus meridionalis]|nr:BTB/POZ domain-containing protein 16 isoform X1 [Silurus meridionalis]
MSAMLSPSSHRPAVCRVCLGLPGRQQRRQTGHTNRWQLAPPLLGDLLGQSQVERAARSGICVHTPSTPEETEDTLLQLQREASPSQQSPPLHTGLCTSQNTQLSRTSARPEHVFYVISQQVVQNARPDAVLECLGSMWELHCPYLWESETLADLYRSSKKKQKRESGVRQKCVSRGSREIRQRQDGEMEKNRGSLTRPILLRLNINDPSITKESLAFALRSMYRCDESPDEWCEGVFCASILLGLPQLQQRCLKEMISSISFLTVCDFHHVSCKYKQTSQHMEEMEKINVFPHAWLHLTFSNIIYSIHNGGNMHITNFSKQAVRFGMIMTRVQCSSQSSIHFTLNLDQEPLIEHCTRSVGLYGFYFLLRASRVGESEAFAFSIEIETLGPCAIGELQDHTAVQYEIGSQCVLSDQCTELCDWRMAGKNQWRTQSSAWPE